VVSHAWAFNDWDDLPPADQTLINRLLPHQVSALRLAQGARWGD